MNIKSTHKRFELFVLLLFILMAVGSVQCTLTVEKKTRDLEVLKRDFIEQRFGMFICYNIMSYGAKWGQADYPISTFNPQKLDCNQWADAAVSAGMKFGLLTTKHHEGFCLWDSKYTTYDVASTSYKKDIVKQYVDSFRKKGLGVGLYYSIWDSTHGVDKDSITDEKMEFIKGQITELLTNYGKISYFVIDGWFWRMGHNEVPYHEIRALIRKLQPECLITDHTHLQAPYHMEIPYFEGPFGAFPAEGNIMASALGHCSLKGNGWFWSEATPAGMKPNDGLNVIVDKLEACEQRYCNFMLNCMPNRDGLLDPIYIDLLKKIGNVWQADNNRPPLPDQGPQVVESIPIQSITASSGNAANLLSGKKIPGGNYYLWESDSVFPQTITLELPSIEQNIDVLTIVPNHRCKPAPETSLNEGNVIKCKLYVSQDNKEYTQVAEKNWEKDALYRAISFKKTHAKYLKLEILDANGPNAIITALEVGRSQL